MPQACLNSRLTAPMNARHVGWGDASINRLGPPLGKGSPMRSGRLALQQSVGARLGTDTPFPPEDRVDPMDAHGVTAIGTLYRNRAPRLLRYFLLRANAQDAADLVQESFARLTAVTRQTQVAPENPSAYLTQIATNMLRDRARTAYQRAIAAPERPHETAGFEDPLATLEARDMLRRVDQSLARLKPLTRDIFLAHRRDGLSYREVGELTGLSIKGVEWHMTKAIAHLTRTLGR